MSKPFWFNTIQQWKKMGKRSYGISFPFLIGAIAYGNHSSIDEKYINNIFAEIESNPVKGYYCGVRWCGTIDEPVASLKPLADIKNVSIQATLNGNDQVSFGFTTDLMSMLNLDCKTADECREKLIIRTLQTVKNGSFSKNNGKFTAFTDSDINFIIQMNKLSIA